jgi:lipopolysaccharide heptosyltransferase I
MRPLRDHPARRIALIKPSALGDIVHSLPVLSALRQRYPDARITWVINRSYEPLLRGHPDLTDTLPFDRGLSRTGWWAGARSAVRFLKELRARRFDLVIDLQGLLRSGVMTAATLAHRRVGLSTAREGAAYAYTDVVPADWSQHAVDRNWRAAEALGVGDAPKRFRVPVSDDARDWAAAALAPLPRPWLVLGVGARWLTKRWPAGHFADLARRARAGFGGSAVFIGSADEAPLARQVADQLTGPALDLTGKTTLPQLAALLARADVMLANDTGPLHLAAALGRPVVAPYTCTRVALHGPFGQADGCAETAVHCAGSYVKRCGRLECMAELTPDRLWGALSARLSAWQRHSRSA